MGPLGTLFRDLLFFQGYVADPELLRALEQDSLASPPPQPGAADGSASPPQRGPALRPAH